MGQIRLKINGRTYPVTCGDGEEDHVRQLGAYFESKVKDLTGSAQKGQISDTHLVVLAALTVCDELSEAYEKLESAGGAGGNGAGGGESAAEDLSSLADAVDSVAERLEQVAGRLGAL